MNLLTTYLAPVSSLHLQLHSQLPEWYSVDSYGLGGCTGHIFAYAEGIRLTVALMDP